MSAGASIRDAAAEISFPRGAGTEGDARVRQILAERLRALGFGVREREFAFDAQRAILRIRAGLLVVAAGLVLAVMHSKIEPALVAGRILLILAGAAFIARALLWDEGLFADKGQRTANVVGRLGEAVRGRVVLVAHHDSKSQNYPFLVRGALIAVGLAGLAAGLLLLVLQLAGVAPDGAAGRALGSAALAGALALALLSLISFQNRSPGALDNAGSVAVVLEVARRFAERPGDRLELVVALTGGEEFLMLGGRVLACESADSWQRDDTLVINLDGVGAAGPVGACGARIEQAREAAQRAGVALRRIRVPLDLFTDSLPLGRAGLEPLTLSSARAGRAARLVHTPRDLPENLDPAALGAAADLVEQLVRGHGR